MDRLTYTVSEVAELLGMSRSKTFELVVGGAIPVGAIPGGASSSPEPPCNASSSSRSAPTALTGADEIGVGRCVSRPPRSWPPA